MTKDDGAQPAPLPRRKAWLYFRPDSPGIGDFLAGGARRKAFVKYWITDNGWNALHLAGHYSMKLLPMDACSALGARLGLLVMPRFHKVAVARARKTIETLRPDLSLAEREALLRENMKSQGRLMTEFSVVSRIARNRDRLQVEGLHFARQALSRGAVVVAGLHLGNWEIAGAVFRDLGVTPHVLYVPPAGRAQTWIAERVRTKGGINLLPPGFAGVGPAVQVLREGGVVIVFCDEGFGGVIRGPFFGRPPYPQGNLALATRLARKTGATICPAYNIRTEGFRFQAHVLPPITLPPETVPRERFVEDMLLLNGVIEPIVRAHLDQWYFLDSAL